MANIKKLVEISGLNRCLIEEPRYFRQLIAQEIKPIPSGRPGIKDVLKTKAQVVIKGSKTIKTPVATSTGGERLTGCQLLVIGDIELFIEYIPVEESTEAIHGLEYSIPFSTYINLPGEYPLAETPFIAGYLQDITIRLLEPKEVFVAIYFLLDVNSLAL